MNKEAETKAAWRVTDERFVAFLDIMGFKEMVARNDHDTIYKKLEKLSESAKETEFLKDIHVTLFSDSVIVFSKNSELNTMLNFFVITSYIMCRTLQLGMGIKGGIAFGELTVNKNRQIYFGQPIIDAFYLQEDLSYYGVALHHSAEKKISESPPEQSEAFRVLKPLYDTFFHESLTTLKSGSITHLNLNWPKDCQTVSGESAASGYDIARKWLRDIKLTVSGAPRRYIDNTVEMIKQMEKSAVAVVSPPTLPQ